MVIKRLEFRIDMKNYNRYENENRNENISSVALIVHRLANK